MQHDPTSLRDPARLELKRCSACARVKRAEDFYHSRGRLSSYCKDCQRRASQLAYRRRRQDPDSLARMRAVDLGRKRRERARLAGCFAHEDGLGVEVMVAFCGSAGPAWAGGVDLEQLQ
jgi:hypothetical protein